MKRERVDYLLFLPTFVVALYLRIAQLGQTPFWADQSILYSIALNFVNGGALPLAANKSSSGAMNPPFVEYLLALPLFVQKTLLSPVYLQVALSLIALIALWWGCRQYFGRGVALLAAALFAVNPWLVYYTRFIWNPNHIPIFATFLIFAILAYLKNARPRYLIAAFILLAIITQLHLSSLVLLPTLVIIALIFHRRFWRGTVWQSVWPFLGGLSLFVLLYVPFFLYERGVGYQDLWRLVSALTGSEMSEMAFIEEPITSVAAVFLARDLATGAGFWQTLTMAWQAEIANWQWVGQLLTVYLVVGLLVGLLRPIHHRLTKKTPLPIDLVAHLVLSLWVILPVIFYLRHTQYLQNYFFLWLYPALLIVLTLPLAIQNLPKAVRVIAALPLLAAIGYHAMLFHSGFQIADEADIVGNFALGDLQESADFLTTQMQARPDCDIILIAEGSQLASSPVGLFEPLLFPHDVRLAPQGRAFIVPASCAIYFVAAADDFSQPFLAANATPLTGGNQTDWQFYSYDATVPLSDALAEWENGLQLIATEIRGDLVPASQINVHLDWRVTQGRPPSDYHFFVHVLDANGQLVAQDDAGTVHPVYWRAGDLLKTQFWVQLPEGFSAETHTIHVGLYSWPDIVRTLRLDGSGAFQLAVGSEQ